VALHQIDLLWQAGQLPLPLAQDSVQRQELLLDMELGGALDTEPLLVQVVA
jgi:hypothetical protein